MGSGSNSVTLRLCGPRGFCAGVDRAIQMVVMALKRYGAPVYVRHEIVHNRYVVDGLRDKGAVFVKELDEIPVGTSAPVIFSAHGVPKSVPEHAQELNLLYFDATCPLVSKVHKQAARHMRLGRQVVLVGHTGHPEVVGTMGQLPKGAVDLIETVEDVASYAPPDPDALGYVTQTTLSVDDTMDVIEALKDRFPTIADPAGESICYATTNRQEAVKAAAPGTDLFLVVGATNSSNSKRLVEVAERAGATNGLLIAGPEDIPMEDVRAGNVIALSAGASAPEILIEGVISRFRDQFEVTLDLVETAQETELFPVARDLRSVELTADDMRFVNG
ncbi:MAG: 4-hydroxy-3-methylbut-2-enyl diphosphate reductase [Cohaesibacteraceae bacterium]